MNAELVAKRIIEFFNKNNLVYTYNENENYFSSGFKLIGKLQNVNLIINIGEDDYVVNAIIPLRVEEASKTTV